MEESDVGAWVERYVRAWNTNDPNDIGDLFTDKAVYYTAPFREPWRGRDGIIREWLAVKDEPGDTEFTYDVTAIDGPLGIVKGRTVYKEPPENYSNLWEIRLDDDGRCYEFIEWWMEEK